MIRFNCDYSEGAHPRILEKLSQTNMEQTEGYGEDMYCRMAAKIIRKKCDRGDADVHFLVGGTQTNLTFISSVLRPHQGVISAMTGHINVHETGAIEATGHKVLQLPCGPEGKLTAEQIHDTYTAHWNDADHEHIVQPKLVYISNSTENGAIYSKEELTAIREVCSKNNLYLYMDGARLAYALEAKNNDLTLPDIANLCDAFYIGGTKVGALFGEALVITNDELQEDFRYIIKQKGGMLAKGRLLGLQFIALLENDLYFELGQHANKMAAMIKDTCERKGFSFLSTSTTNQQFPIIPDKDLEILNKSYEYAYWQRVDDTRSAVRFCTSWATREEDVLQLIEDIRKL